jgi:hypothetical protein
MSDDFGTPTMLPGEPPRRKTNTALIVTIVVLLVLCCCCAGMLWFTYSFLGDWVLSWFGFN